jgi:hypothetical protein
MRPRPASTTGAISHYAWLWRGRLGPGARTLGQGPCCAPESACFATSSRWPIRSRRGGITDSFSRDRNGPGQARADPDAIRPARSESVARRAAAVTQFRTGAGADHGELAASEDDWIWVGARRTAMRFATVRSRRGWKRWRRSGAGGSIGWRAGQHHRKADDEPEVQPDHLDVNPQSLESQ